MLFIDTKSIILLNWDIVLRATTFFISFVLRERRKDTNKDNLDRINLNILQEKGEWKIANKIPEATKVEEWTKDLTTVGAVIAKHNHTLQGTWEALALLAIYKKIPLFHWVSNENIKETLTIRRKISAILLKSRVEKAPSKALLLL